MEPINITELMEASANDAIEFAKEQQIELDFSLDSVALIQQLLELIRQEPLDDKTSFTLSYMLGAYLGELFIKNYGGYWFYEQPEEEPPQTFVIHDPYKYAFPSLVYHYLNEQEELKLTDYFAALDEQQKALKS